MENFVLSVLDRRHIMGIVILMLQLWVSYTVGIVGVMVAIMLMRIVMLIRSLIRGVLIVFLTVVVHVVRMLLGTMDSVENVMLPYFNRSDVVSVIILMLELGMGHRVVVMRMMMAYVLVWIMVLIWRLIWRILIVFLTIVIHVV